VAVRTVTRGQAEAGAEVHVATTDDDGAGRLPMDLSMPIRDNGVVLWYFARQSAFYTFSLPLTRWLATHAGRYDIVHIHALFSYASLPAAFFARRSGVPYVVRPLGTLSRWGLAHRRPSLKRLSFPLIERRILAGAAAVHYTSVQEREEASALCIAAPSVVIPNPVEVPSPGELHRGRFRTRHALGGRKIVLFLSRLDPKKGLDLLLDAFSQVCRLHPEATLVIAGEGNKAFVSGLQARASRLGLGADVIWAGHLEGAAKWEALVDASVFALPSYSENFGIAAVEAMALGVPVVVSDQVGVHHEVSGVRAGAVARCEAGALARELTAILDDKALAKEMGRNGKELARTSFSERTVTSKLLGLYETLSQERVTV
jgi:glycosyltransferase involved in cell wall biosynthesis